MEVIANAPYPVPEEEFNTDRYKKEIEAFFETKTGVQGLVEAGVTKIPRFFIHSQEDLPKSSPNTNAVSFQPLVIDMEGFGGSRRAEIVNQIRKASVDPGFFQIINHGFPVDVMEEMLAGVKRFHQQPQEQRKKWYTFDPKQPVKYFTNGDLFGGKGRGNWGDTIVYQFPDSKQDPLFFPEICREAVSEYIKYMCKLRDLLSEIISEALGLHSGYLSSIECLKSAWFACHYYPPCPEPDLTIGSPSHTDPPFLTILLQDDTGGLQFFHQNQWIDLPPLRGAFIVNIGDLLQLISNDKFKSPEHRVLAARTKGRASVAAQFAPSTANAFKRYGPIKELLSGNPPIYRETDLTEYTAYFKEKKADGISRLSAFRLA